jgi:SAM-dependent methyltransferase
MSNPKTIACVACGHLSHTFVAKIDDRRKMVRCDYCGLIFTIPLWTDEVVANVFASAEHNWPKGISPPNEHSKNRESTMTYIAREITNRKPAGGRLLDVGCADGSFLEAMHLEADNWESFGVEPDPKWQEFGYQNAVVKLHPLRNCDFPNDFFDVITLLDTLYYIPEPDRELMEISRIVKPTGLLVFDIPSQFYLHLRGFVGGLLGMRHTRLFAAYPFYFSDRSLRILLKHAGLEVIGILADRGTDHPETIPRILLSSYFGLVKGAAKVSRRFLFLSPKLVYFVCRSEVPSSVDKGMSS